jgi:membrane protease YdiL (CAAX protease family)
MQPRVWTVFVALVLAFLLIIILQAAVLLPMVLMDLSRGVPPTALQSSLQERLSGVAMFILLTSCGQLAFLLAALVPAWLSPVPLARRLALAPASGSMIFWTTLGSIPVLAVALGLVEALARVLPPDPGLQQFFDAITLGESIPFVLFIALAPGFCEELFFRGYVQSRLLERWSPLWAIGVTSLLFALVHVMPHAILAALPLGIWFGVVAWRTGSILPGMFCHAFVNGGLNAWRMIVKFEEVTETAQFVLVGISLAIGAPAFLIACGKLRAAQAALQSVANIRVEAPLTAEQRVEA